MQIHCGRTAAQRARAIDNEIRGTELFELVNEVDRKERECQV